MFRHLKTYTLAALVFAAMPVSAAWSADTTYAVVHLTEPALAADMGRIYFYREGGIMGTAIRPAIKVNDEKVGDSRPGDYFYIDRPAGSYEISTTTEKKEDLTLPLTAGQSVYVRFDISMGLFAGHVSPSVIDPAKAAEEIKDCDYDATGPG